MERLDDLLIGDLKIWQRNDEFCFSIDAILLAHFAPIHSHKKYGDLGCGTGVIPLILSARGAQKIVGFELNTVVAALAKKSVAYNRLNTVITIEEGDYRQAHSQYGGYFDGLFVNPPYFKNGHGKENLHRGMSLALHESETSLEEVACTAKRLLRFGGTLWMIYTTSQLAYALKCLRIHRLEPKRLRFVHSQMNKPSKLVLIEARLGGKEGMLVEAPLFIYTEANVYSDEIMKWYGKKG